MQRYIPDKSYIMRKLWWLKAA